MHFAFKLVWIISAFAFGRFAYDAHQTESLILPRHIPRIENTSSATNSRVGGIRMSDVVDMANGMADTYDKSVDELERSIHHSARLSFHLNMMCCAAALIGFSTQFGQYWNEHGKKKKGTNSDPQGQGQPGPSSVKLGEGEQTEDAAEPPQP